jgi:alpha-glucosidase
LTGYGRYGNYLCLLPPSVRLLLLLSLGFASPAGAQTFTLRAPDQPLEAIVRAGRDLTLELRYRGRTIASTPPLGLDVDGLVRADALPAVTDSARRHVDTTIRPAVPEKRAAIADRYNELRLSMGPSLAVTFRAYDDGVAYRFETAFADSVTIRTERAGLRVADADSVYIALATCDAEVDCFHSGFEENYVHLPVRDVPHERLAFLPVLVETQGVHLVFTESDL